MGPLMYTTVLVLLFVSPSPESLLLLVVDSILVVFELFVPFDLLTRKVLSNTLGFPKFNSWFDLGFVLNRCKDAPDTNELESCRSFLKLIITKKIMKAFTRRNLLILLDVRSDYYSKIKLTGLLFVSVLYMSYFENSSHISFPLLLNEKNNSLLLFMLLIGMCTSKL